jgi:hypothetical protein
VPDEEPAGGGPPGVGSGRRLAGRQRRIEGAGPSERDEPRASEGWRILSSSDDIRCPLASGRTSWLQQTSSSLLILSLPMVVSNTALAWYQRGPGEAALKLVIGILVGMAMFASVETLYQRSHRRDHIRAAEGWPCA